MSGILDKLSGLLKKDVRDVFSAENIKNITKIVNTDVTDLVGDAKAQRILTKLEKHPDNIDYHLELAETYKSLRKLDKAVDIYIGIAQKYFERQNLSQANYFIEIALEILPDHGPLNMFSADVDIRMGRYSQAPSKYRKATSYFIKKHDRMTAVYLLRRIKDMNKATDKDLLNLAGLLIAESMHKDAKEILKILLDKFQNRGGASLRDKEACLMMLHSIDKNDKFVLAELVETRIEMKEYERALVLLKRLLSSDSKNIALLKRKAYIHKMTEDIENQIKVFKEIASIYSEQGNLVYRNIFYHKILKLNPKDVEALTVLKMDDQLRENISTKIENTDSKIKMVDLE
jgi:tetratricopeptide (TPR) repeat protein